MPRRKLQKNNPSIDYGKRKWIAVHDDDEILLRQLFDLLNNKLTVNEISAIPVDKLSDMVEAVRKGELSFEKIESLEPNEFYEFITGVESEED